MGCANSIAATLKQVVDLLVQRSYADIEQLTHGRRLRASEIEEGVRNYGRTLARPPLTAFSQADVIPISGTDPRAYSVRFRLFTQEEGQSDLELQATFIDVPGQAFMRVELDGILVA